MYVRFPFFLLLGLLGCLSAQAQLLTGRVVAPPTSLPVAYATVGVKGRPLGSTTDDAGRFAFAVPAALPATDSVIISCVGFQSRRLTVGQLRQPDAVWTLQPGVQALQEVQVRHGRLTPAILGRQALGGSAHWTTAIRDNSPAAAGLNAGRDERGWEVSTLLPVRKSCYLDAFHVYIEQNGFDPIRLRFTLYAVENGKPRRQLLTDDIQFTIPREQTGWTSVDLSQYNIQLPKGQTVAAGIQWLQGTKLPTSAKAFGGPGAFPSPTHRVAVRNKSEDEWKVLPVNVSMYLAVQQYE
ncbi:carboxypeptidase-like regulatory domain-containing protein [Hymenobacter coalescens]